ncbi:RDD family protein [Promicromonospora sp. NPDC050249]|uniref:RDD family protein n=1 Tax=Promicromonospora sp. NPDC050249 TaxID=3154743 RepID=UPI0034110234
MTAVVCAGCGVSQQEGAPFCAACGRAFPRTGLPVVEPQQTPRGQVQQAAAAAQARQSSASGGVPLVTSRPPITTEVEVYTATQIPSAGMAPQQQLEAPYARVGKRFLALLIDGGIAGVLGGIVAGIGLLFIETPDPLVVLSQEQRAEMFAQLMRLYVIAGAVAFAFMLSMWIWESRTGRTVGNSAMGLRTVSADDRGPLGFGREVIRVLMLGVISLIPVAGPVIVHLTPLWDKGDKIQGWHDKVARSVVLDLRAPKIAVTTGLAPVGPGPRAPGRPALRTATPSAPVQQTSRQLPSQAPAAPQHPGTPPVAAPDPWSFPQAPVAPPAGGIITGIPGSAPGASPAAQPVQQPQPVQQQPVQQHPVQSQPVQQVQHQQPPEPAWPSKTWPAQVEPAAPPVQQPVAPPVRHELPPQQHPESRPTRPVTFPGEGAAQAPAQAEESWEATRMQAPSLVPAAVVTVVLELESGARHVIDGPALVGRNPQAADGSPTILVRVDDPTRSVSKNHAEMGVDPAGLWLTDRGSTNGTVVSAPGRSPQVAEPGARVRVPMGSTIHVGDRRIVVHPDESKA